MISAYRNKPEAALELSNLNLEADLAEKDASLHTIEGNLQESEARFYSLADNAPVLIWLSDAQGNCTYVNQTWESLTGQSLESQLGDGWLETIHPEDRDRVKDLFQESCAQQYPFEQEFRQARADGVYRWILATGVPRIAADQFAGLICSCMDISDIKHSQKRLEQAIQELQRSNQELEQFAYIASHDLREPLRKIQSFAELFTRRFIDKAGSRSKPILWVHHVRGHSGCNASFKMYCNTLGLEEATNP